MAIPAPRRLSIFVPLSRSVASGTLTWQWTSTVFTRLFPTSTALCFLPLPTCAGLAAAKASQIWQPEKTTPAEAPATRLIKSLRFGIASPLAGRNACYKIPRFSLHFSAFSVLSVPKLNTEGAEKIWGPQRIIGGDQLPRGSLQQFLVLPPPFSRPPSPSL